MREGCLDCMFKHLGQAAVWENITRPYPVAGAVRCLTHLGQARILQAEVFQGYPEHAGLFVGHLACASDEVLTRDPDLALRIRKERLQWSSWLYGGKAYQVPIAELIHAVSDEAVLDVGPNVPGNDLGWLRYAMILGHLSEAAEESAYQGAEVAPRIFEFLQEWQDSLVAKEQPRLDYVGLFDSLVHTMKEESSEDPTATDDVARFDGDEG